MRERPVYLREALLFTNKSNSQTYNVASSFVGTSLQVVTSVVGLSETFHVFQFGRVQVFPAQHVPARAGSTTKSLSVSGLLPTRLLDFSCARPAALVALRFYSQFVALHFGRSKLPHLPWRLSSTTAPLLSHTEKKADRTLHNHTFHEYLLFSVWVSTMCDWKLDVSDILR